MNRPFKDHFSLHAGDYAAHRPQYPSALFEWLSRMAPARGLAWDAGTGNGQAATRLALHFDRVVATDASPEQIAAAAAHERVDYRVAPAEQSGLPDASCDLVTCAQAVHWFDIAAFTTEVRRVLRPGGVIAVWCYGFFCVDPEIDAPLTAFHRLVEPFWPPERAMIDDGYRSLPFPFEEIEPPPLEMGVSWAAEQAVAYLYTWSATQRFLAGGDPEAAARAAASIATAWGGGTRRVRWPLHMRVGRVSS